MDRPDLTLRRVATIAGYALLGVVGTAAVALGALSVLRPIQRAVYHAVYLRLGPADATEFAILLGFVLAAALGLAVVTLVGEYLSDRGANRRAVLAGIAALAGLLLLYVAVSIAGLVGLPVALAWSLVAALAVPLLVRFRYGARSGATPAFVGGIPVVVLVLLLAGFGLGWGWGYVLVAEEVPASDVGDAEVADFDSVPRVRDDLFAGDCSGPAGGGETCYLYLRGYEHETAAARFLADHGVRCPYRGSPAEPGSFVARHDGSYYRVTCASHGD